MKWVLSVAVMITLALVLVRAERYGAALDTVAAAQDSVVIYRALAKEAEDRARQAEQRAWCYTEEISRLRLWYEPPDTVTATHLYWDDPCRPGDKNRFWTIRIW